MTFDVKKFHDIAAKDFMAAYFPDPSQNNIKGAFVTGYDREQVERSLDKVKEAEAEKALLKASNINKKNEKSESTEETEAETENDEEENSPVMKTARNKSKDRDPEMEDADDIIKAAGVDDSEDSDVDIEDEENVDDNEPSDFDDMWDEDE